MIWRVLSGLSIVILVLSVLLSGCKEDEVIRIRGALDVTVYNASERGEELRFSIDTPMGLIEEAIDILDPLEVFAGFDDVGVGNLDLRIAVADAAASEIQAIRVVGVSVFHLQTTSIYIDFERIQIAPGDQCVAGLCAICVPGGDGAIAFVEDDPDCGILDCTELNYYVLNGNNTASGIAQCVMRDYSDLRNDRCLAIGRCKPENDPDYCLDYDDRLVAEAGLCRVISGCQDSLSPEINVSPDGTPCGSGRICQGGDCIVPGEDCRPVLCGECRPGDDEPRFVRDDPDCGVIDCSELDHYELVGTNTAAGTSQCLEHSLSDITSNRCLEVGQCIPENDPDYCTDVDSRQVASAGLCRLIRGCDENTAPSISVVPDGTPCGGDRICQSGNCVDRDPEVDRIGCSDGSREGFVDIDEYPFIAGCSGGWEEPGVVHADAPMCNRQAGNESSNPNGYGCSAADLCSEGWSICINKEEVESLSHTGCEGAVPPGTPEHGLLFVARQRSVNDSICEDAPGTGENDLFGCGNLGDDLVGKNCEPLNKVLASTADNDCGWNQAKPEWTCPGDSLSEGASVVKIGPDKGGVLCCRNP